MKEAVLSGHTVIEYPVALSLSCEGAERYWWPLWHHVTEVLGGRDFPERLWWNSFRTFMAQLISGILQQGWRKGYVICIIVEYLCVCAHMGVCVCCYNFFLKKLKINLLLSLRNESFYNSPFCLWNITLAGSEEVRSFRNNRNTATCLWLVGHALSQKL